MVVIVVLAAVFHVGSERRGQLFRLVFGDEIHHVVGNERGEPANVLARGFQVAGRPDGGGSHDLYFGEVAAGFFGAFADEAEAPFDEIGIGELKNDAVADASGGAESFGAIARDPHAGDFAAGPREFCGDAIEVNGFTCVEIAEDADEFFERFERGGLFAKNAAGTVAAADAQLHTAVRSEIQRGEEAGGDGDIADGGISDASAEMHVFGVGGHQGEKGKRVFPEDVRVENPAVGEAGSFGLLREAEDTVDGDVRFDGDAEVHGMLRD